MKKRIWFDIKKRKKKIWNKEGRKIESDNKFCVYLLIRLWNSNTKSTSLELFYITRINNPIIQLINGNSNKVK